MEGADHTLNEQYRSREGDERQDEIMSEEEDEVVAEFDVCLAGSLRDQLQLL